MNALSATCTGADGTCEQPAQKAGLCWAHYKRRQLGLKKPLAAPVRERTRTPFDALHRAMLEFQDELDTATEEDWQRNRERFRTALRRYLWVYVPKLLRRASWSTAARQEIEAFLATYGDKAGHSQHRKSPQHSAIPPKQFNPKHRRSTP